MRILSKQFAMDWSWSGIATTLHETLSEHEWIIGGSHEEIDGAEYDVILSQQITLIRFIKQRGRAKTVCRLGGNYSFEEGVNTAYDGFMQEVFAIIATNQKLYNIAKRQNPRTYLIPNGIDLKEWSPVSPPVDKFVVGFVANISKPQYREYKGYDLVEQACKELGVELKMALYKEKQIPHNQMREKFYSEVSCIVHPTKGEGCSNTLMEALACGVPVITTREAGFHGERLEEGKNVLFCERTVESIKEKILALQDESVSGKLSKEGRKFALENHDIKKIGKQYNEIFNECYLANLKKEKQMYIVGTLNQGNINWCWGTSIRNVATALKDKVNIELVSDREHEKIKTMNPDLVWCRGSMIFVKSLWKERPDLPEKTISTVTIGGEMLEGRISKEMRFEAKNLAYIVQNNDAKARMELVLKNMGVKKPVYLIPVAVDAKIFSPSKDKPKEFIVGFAGRKDTPQVLRQKGFPLVKQACDILGLQLKVCSTDIGERLSYNQMPDWYRSISVLMLPSYAEGCSNVTMEAMACGIPVIANNVGYHGEMCKDYENILFASRNVYEMAEKLKELKNNPALYKKLSENGVAFAKQHSLEKIAEKYYAMFKEVYAISKNRTKEMIDEDVKKHNKYFKVRPEEPIAQAHKKGKKFKYRGGAMYIRYMGAKKVKKVWRNYKEYVFDPICYVADEKVCKWLLSKEMRGLFVPVDNQEIPEEAAAMEQVPNKQEKPAPIATKPVDPLQCPYCPFIAKSLAGLMAHIRIKHGDKK